MAKKPTEVEIAKENIRHAVWQDTPEKEVKIGNVVLLKYDPDTHGMYLATDGYTLEKILGRIGPIPENGISVSIRMEMSVEADYLYQRVDGIGCLPRNDSPVPFRWTARKAYRPERLGVWDYLGAAASIGRGILHEIGDALNDLIKNLGSDGYGRK